MLTPMEWTSQDLIVARGAMPKHDDGWHSEASRRQRSSANAAHIEQAFANRRRHIMQHLRGRMTATALGNAAGISRTSAIRALREAIEDGIVSVEVGRNCKLYRRIA